MQPNLNRTSTGLGKVTPPLPKGDLLPKSLLSPLEHFWATALERSQKNYFYIREMSFYFYSPHTGKKILFLPNFSDTFSSGAGWAWCSGVRLPSFSPLKRDQSSSSLGSLSSSEVSSEGSVLSPLGEVFQRGDAGSSQRSAARGMTGQLVRWASPKSRGLGPIAKRRGFDGLNGGPQWGEYFCPCIQDNT